MCDDSNGSSSHRGQDLTWEKVPGGHVKLTSCRLNGVAHAAWFAKDSKGTAAIYSSRELAAAAVAPRPATRPPGATQMDPSSQCSDRLVRNLLAGDAAEDHRPAPRRRPPPRPPAPSSISSTLGTRQPSPVGDAAEDHRWAAWRRPPPRPPTVPPADLLTWDLLSSDGDPAAQALAHNGCTSRNSKTKVWYGGLAILLFGAANVVIPFTSPSAEQVALPGNNLVALAAYSSVLESWKKGHPQKVDEQPPV